MPSILPGKQPGRVNRLLAATQHTRQVAPDTREPGAGDFTGPTVLAGTASGEKGVWVEEERGSHGRNVSSGQFHHQESWP